MAALSRNDLNPKISNFFSFIDDVLLLETCANGSTGKGNGRMNYRALLSRIREPCKEE
jgi:hypothetical protein